MSRLKPVLKRWYDRLESSLAAVRGRLNFHHLPPHRVPTAREIGNGDQQGLKPLPIIFQSLRDVGRQRTADNHILRCHFAVRMS